MATYATLTDFNAWLSNRAIDDTWTDDQKNGALYIAANDYIDVFFVFRGIVEDENQELALPTDQVEVNAKVIQASCEAAYLYLQGKLFNTEASLNGAVVRTMTKEKLDVLEEESEIEYTGKGSTSYFISHPQIERLLKSYLAYGSGAGLTNERVLY